MTYDIKVYKRSLDALICEASLVYAVKLKISSENMKAVANISFTLLRICRIQR